MSVRLAVAVSVSIGLSWLVLAGRAGGQTRTGLLVEPVRVRTQQILGSVAEGSMAPNAATEEARALFLWLVAYADPQKEAGAFREGAIAIGAARLLSCAEPGSVRAVSSLLRDAPDLAARLAFMTSAKDKPEELRRLVEVLNEMRVAAGSDAARLNEYSGLVAAICTVHDGPKQPVKAARASAYEILQFFTAPKAPARFSVKEVPAALLVHVVDFESPLTEMEWARRQYAGADRLLDIYLRIVKKAGETPTELPPEAGALGALVHRVETHQQGGEPIVDRAAAEIGKALVIPTVLVSLWDSEEFKVVASIGVENKIIEWDYSVGGNAWPGSLRGTTVWPVTGQKVDFSYIQILGWAFNYPVVERESAMALADAARALAGLEKASDGYPPPPDALATALGSGRVPRFRRPDRHARDATVDQALAFVDAAVKVCPAVPNVWAPVRELARDGRMTLAQKQKWADLIARACGKNQPDFSWDMLRPMVASVQDPEEQSRLWDKMYANYQGHGDLAARARFAQGELWEKQGDTDRALRSYGDLVDRFPYWGELVTKSLERMDTALTGAGRGSEVIPLYIRVWERLNKPKPSWPTPAWNASAWCQVGGALADRLEAASRTTEAQKVRSAITAP